MGATTCDAIAASTFATSVVATIGGASALLIKDIEFVK
jgi:hypothetical protein